MASSLSQLNLFSPILQLGIVNRDHLDLSVIMEVDAKSEWLESGLADFARLSSSYKNLVLTIWKQQIDKVQLHAKIMFTFWSSNEKYFQFEANNLSDVSIAELELINAIKKLDILRISKSAFWKIVHDYFHAKHSISKVLQSNRINYSCFKLIVNAFTKIRRKLWKLQTQQSRVRSPNYANELSFLQKYMEDHFGERITLGTISKEVEARSQELKWMSRSTISILLKRKLYYKYKKSVSLSE